MLSNAVEEVFVRLYDKGLIYRGDRIINWCPSCHTAISDAEVDHEDAHGYLWHVKYPIKNSDQFITIATTRPETILGDLAVAVHPDDDRYSHLVGKTALVPIINREIPVIADPYVEMEFGTGALKITPSHDPNDFEVGERHGLGQCVVINEDGFMNSNAAEFEGLERFEARKTVAKALEERGYLETVKDHDNAVGHCERCKTIIEPLISKQWFVRMEPLAKPSLEAYYNGELRFIPERFGKVYTHWLENIKDWCISRQLWWGHRLPVYYCDDCGEIIVSREKITKCSKCESTNIRQETDTLDTWFSSALWPFSTLGWPEDTEDMDYFFPTDVLVTGYDIIFFWVIRMVFSSLEQTGELPFKDVFLTGLVRDSLGRKMSKSLGNGIDPLELIEEYGADALRFTLVTGNTPGNDMRFYTERVEASRNFANKLWNATRFVMMNLDDETEDYTIDTKELEPEDKWIITRLNKVIGDVKSNLDKYELGLAAQRVYDFIWEDYCDWYIEMTKTRLYGEDKTSRATAQQVLVSVLRDTLKLLHPFMPFITEEIWQHLPGKSDALIMEAWPKPDSASLFEESEKNIEFIKSAIKGIRNARAEMNIVPSRKAGLIFVTEDESLKEIISQSEKKFRTLASADSITFTSDKSGFGEGFVSVVLDGCEVFLPLADLIDFDKELERLEKEKAKLEDEIKRVDAKLSNQGFVAKAPAKVVDEEKEKQIKYKQMLENVLERINSLKK
jgi:valyl-tRNA synthetase